LPILGSIDRKEYYRFSNRHTPKGVQCAFKDSMIHGKQFTLRIAFRCVLHRCESQEIRCQKLFLFYRYFRQKIHWFIMLGLGSTESSQDPKYSWCTVVYRQLGNLLGDSTQHGKISNDPTAGSPTVTLLRLLVPLNDQV